MLKNISEGPERFRGCAWMEKKDEVKSGRQQKWSGNLLTPGKTKILMNNHDRAPGITDGTFRDAAHEKSF